MASSRLQAAMAAARRKRGTTTRTPLNLGTRASATPVKKPGPTLTAQPVSNVVANERFSDGVQPSQRRLAPSGSDHPLALLNEAGYSSNDIRALDRWNRGSMEGAVSTINNQKWAPSPMDPMQQARDNVALEYDERIRAIERAAGRAERNFDKNIDIERTFAGEVDPRIANIYNALGNDLRAGAAENQQTYNSAIDRIRSFYDEANQANAGLNADIMARITGDAERLGIEAGIPGGTQQMTEDYQWMQAMGNNQKAGRSANIAELAMKIGALDNRAVGASQREGAQQRASLQNEVARTLGEIGIAGYNELGEYRGQQNSLEQDRATAIRQELARLMDKQHEQGRQGKLDALQEFLALRGQNLQEAQYRRGNFTDDRNFGRGVLESDREYNRGVLESDRNFGLAERELGANITQQDWERRFNESQSRSDAQQKAFSNQIALRELALRERQLEAEIAASNDPARKAMLQAELNNTKANTARINAETAALMAGGGNDPASGRYKGQQGLEQWMSSPGVWGDAAGPKFREGIKSLIAQAEAESARTGVPAYQLAMKRIQDTGGMGLNPNSLITGLNIFYNKYASNAS